MADQKFHVGDTVALYLFGAGYITTEEGWTIGVINDEGIWLDTGIGNDPMGPFDTNGEQPTDPYTGFKKWIRKVEDEQYV